MKTKNVKILSLMLVLLMAAAVFASCGRNQSGLNEAQEKQLINIAEAFSEWGYDYKSGDALTNSKIEMFVCCLYNDKLTVVRNGFGTIGHDEADEMVKSILGVAPAIHKNYSSDGSSPLYSSGTNYYIKVEEPNYVSSEISDVVLGEDGNYSATVLLTASEGQTFELHMVFKLNGDSIRVYECTQYVTR